VRRSSSPPSPRARANPTPPQTRTTPAHARRAQRRARGAHVSRLADDAWAAALADIAGEKDAPTDIYAALCDPPAAAAGAVGLGAAAARGHFPAV
jgi:hypothetical protein